MNNNYSEQEELCLQVKYLCDYLRTKLFLIEDFKHYDVASKQLKLIKSEVSQIYWDL